jgi:hypothetical protein
LQRARWASFGNAQLPGRLSRERSLLELLDFVKLPGRHLVNQLLNRRNVRLANLYELQVRKSSPVGGRENPPLVCGASAIRRTTLRLLPRKHNCTLLECVKASVFKDVRGFGT